MQTKAPNESLRHDRADRGCHQKGLQAKVDQARDGRGRIVRVQRAEDKMPGETRVRRDRGGLQIPNLSDHDNVRRLPQDGAKRGRKSHPDVGVHLHLVDSSHLILDRFFDRDDLPIGFVQVVEAGVEGARFSGPGRSRHEQDTVRQAQ